jgi:AcrR family transcriptional regulator
MRLQATLISFKANPKMRPSLEAKVETTRLGILEVAERLFGQMGFEKTTVYDIARELRMSSANIYRFFSSKAAIDQAVARRLLGAVEAAGEVIAAQPEPARGRLRALLASIETANEKRFLTNRKLHDLLEAAFSQNWLVARDHVTKITGLLSEIISQGNRDGEFAAGDPEFVAILIRSACIRFWHPRLMVEWFDDPEPTLDQIADFCVAALAEGVSAPKRDAKKGVHRLRPAQNIAAAN